MYKCRHAGMCDYKESGSICSFEGQCGAREKIPEPKDLVEVVRCKDCKWWDKEQAFIDAQACGYWSVDKKTIRYTRADDYCSLGEVRWKIGNKIKEVRNEDTERML